MDELRAALKRITPFVDATYPDLDDDLARVVEAARLVANPNLQAAGDKYVEWIGRMIQEGYITINKPMADQDPQYLIVAAAHHKETRMGDPTIPIYEGEHRSDLKFLVPGEMTIPSVSVNGVLYEFAEPIPVRADDEITIEIMSDEMVAINISHRYEAAALTRGDTK